MVAGTISMAYTALKPPEWMSLPEVQAARKDTIKIIRAAMERGWERYPSEEKEKAIAAAQQMEDDKLAELEVAIGRAWHSEQNSAARANLGSSSNSPRLTLSRSGDRLGPMTFQAVNGSARPLES